MQAVSTQKMRELDKRATEIYGIPSLILMENAGRGVAEFVHSQFKDKRITIFTGKGNNGGDGFVIARHLFNRGFKVLLITTHKTGSLQGDALLNFEITQKMKIPTMYLTTVKDCEPLTDIIRKTDLAIDAMLGIGVTRPLEGLLLKIAEILNKHARHVLAVDVPSGLNSDTGEVAGTAAIRASFTATMAAPKTGFFQGVGPEYTGRVCVIDIGIPRIELAQAEV